MQMQKQLNKILLVLALLLFCCINVQSEIVKSEEGVLVNQNEGLEPDNKTEIKEEAEEKTKPVYYTLIDQSLQPEETEFYVKSIFRLRGEIKAAIAKSKEVRAGEMFNLPLTYGKGDKLTEKLLIKDIVLGIGRHIVVEDISTGQDYSLRLSYGNTVSRLVPIAKETSTK